LGTTAYLEIIVSGNDSETNRNLARALSDMQEKYNRFGLLSRVDLTDSIHLEFEWYDSYSRAEVATKLSYFGLSGKISYVEIQPDAPCWTPAKAYGERLRGGAPSRKTQLVEYDVDVLDPTKKPKPIWTGFTARRKRIHERTDSKTRGTSA
jgi:hypothetical protein